MLVAALTIFFGLLFAYFRFPRVYHPLFELEAFRSASIDGLWLSAAVPDERAEAVAAALRGLGATEVSLVPDREET